MPFQNIAGTQFHDVGLAAAALTVQATVFGLVVHQMAGFDVEKARREFLIPQDYEPVAVAAIGYPGNTSELPEKLRNRNASQRKPLAKFVFERGWGHAADWTRTVVGLGEGRDQKNKTTHPATSSAIAHSRSKLSHVCRSSRKPTFS